MPRYRYAKQLAPGDTVDGFTILSILPGRGGKIIEARCPNANHFVVTSLPKPFCVRCYYSAENA